MKLEVSSVSGPHWKNAKKLNVFFSILAFSVRVFTCMSFSRRSQSSDSDLRFAIKGLDLRNLSPFLQLSSLKRGKYLIYLNKEEKHINSINPLEPETFTIG